MTGKIEHFEMSAMMIKEALDDLEYSYKRAVSLLMQLLVAPETNNPTIIADVEERVKQFLEDEGVEYER